MKKLVALAAGAAILMYAIPAFADQPPKGEKGIKGQAGYSNEAFVELWEKDPSTWDIVEGGAWGKLKYHLAGSEFEYVFNGHGLTPGTSYSLIYYPKPQTTWPWPVTVIATGTANVDGDLHLLGSYDFGEDLSNVNIWLVLSSDIVGGSISGWNPTEYLFEYDLISYDDTDV